MRKALKKHWFEVMVSLVVLLGIAGGISVVFGYVHRTNDDVLLRSIVSGSYTGIPDAHLVYMMYPLGLVLKTLYSVANNVSWYDWFVVVLHYFCWWAIVLRIAVLFKNKWNKLLAIGIAFVLLVILDLPYVVMNQYTVLAGICAATAVLWLVLLDASKKESLWIQVAMIVFLMTLVLWIRKEVFYMALPIGGCVLLYQWLMHWKKEGFAGTWLKTQAVLLGVILGIAGISFAVEWAAYSNEEWKYFNAYNAARTNIFDYYNLAPYDLNQAAYEAEKIGTVEYEVINSMSLILMPELDADKLERLADLSKWHKEQMEQYYSVYRKTMYSVCNVIFYNEVQPIGFVLNTVSVCVLMLLFLKKRKEGVLAVLAALAYEMLFVGYFLWKERFPERVSYGLYAMILLVFVGILLKERAVFFEQEEASNTLFWRIVPLAVLAFIFVNVGLYQYRNVSDQIKEYKQGIDQWKQVQAYAGQNADKVYLIKANMAGLKGDRMYLTVAAEAEPENTLLLGTWLSESPHYNLRSANLGLGIIGEEFALKDNILLMQPAEDNIVWLTDYYALKGYDSRAEVVDMIETAAGNIEVVEMK